MIYHYIIHTIFQLDFQFYFQFAGDQPASIFQIWPRRTP